MTWYVRQAIAWIAQNDSAGTVGEFSRSSAVRMVASVFNLTVLQIYNEAQGMRRKP